MKEHGLDVIRAAVEAVRERRHDRVDDAVANVDRAEAERLAELREQRIADANEGG